MECQLGNEFEDYSELLEVLYRFRRKRDTVSHENAAWKLVTNALRMLTDELGKERSFLSRKAAPPAKQSKAVESLADVLSAYNELNREEVELDRRGIDAQVIEKIRRRPRLKE